MEVSREQQLMQTIINNAWEDEAFKQELMNSPQEVIEKVLEQKINLSDGKQIQVVDQTDSNVIYINIPAEPNMENVELNEEQLEAVAGGTSPFPFPSTNWQDLIDLITGKDGR